MTEHICTISLKMHDFKGYYSLIKAVNQMRQKHGYKKQPTGSIPCHISKSFIRGIFVIKYGMCQAY